MVGLRATPIHPIDAVYDKAQMANFRCVFRSERLHLGQ